MKYFPVSTLLPFILWPPWRIFFPSPQWPDPGRKSCNFHSPCKLHPRVLQGVDILWGLGMMRVERVSWGIGIRRCRTLQPLCRDRGRFLSWATVVLPLSFSSDWPDKGSFFRELGKAFGPEKIPKSFPFSWAR